VLAQKDGFKWISMQRIALGRRERKTDSNGAIERKKDASSTD